MWALQWCVNQLSERREKVKAQLVPSTATVDRVLKLKLFKIFNIFETHTIYLIIDYLTKSCTLKLFKSVLKLIEKMHLKLKQNGYTQVVKS